MLRRGAAIPLVVFLSAELNFVVKVSHGEVKLLADLPLVESSHEFRHLADIELDHVGDGLIFSVL